MCVCVCVRTRVCVCVQLSDQDQVVCNVKAVVCVRGYGPTEAGNLSDELEGANTCDHCGARQNVRHTHTCQTHA